MNEIIIYINNITLSAGTERATVNLANNLDDAGYQVTIVSVFSSQGRSYYTINKTINLKHLGCKTSKHLLRRLINSVNVYFKMKKVKLSKNKVCHIGTNHLINILLSIRSFNEKNKFIGCEHLSYGAATSLTGQIRRFFYKYLNAVVVLTQDDLAKYTTLDKLRNCYVIPNQISFYPEKGSSCKEKRLLAIGRLSEQKGFDIMVDVVSPVLKEHPEWELTIIGEGELGETLKEQILNRKISKQIKIEPFTKDIIPKFLESSVYLMTSRHEGLPMVLLEAKACGLPILSFDCPTGPKDLIKEEEDGFLVSMGDKDKFRSKLDFLILNESERIRMGQKSRENVLEYSSSKILCKWKELFNKL